MIAVVGGTGTLGSALVSELLERGEQVRILSRRQPTSLAPDCEHLSLDLSSNDGGRAGGLASALEGVTTVVDAANNATRPGPVMLDGSEQLIAACGVAGVGHFVGISIVGCEKVGLGYYKAKARQEQLVRESPVPWSLLRATQFHELVESAFASSARFRLLPGGSAALQPIAAESAAAALASIALDEPLRDARQIAGPQICTLGELAGQWKRATGGRGAVLPLPMIGRTGRALAAGAFTLPSKTGSGPDFETWLGKTKLAPELEVHE